MGDGVVAQLVDYLAQTQPGLRGFTRSNFFRMCQFYKVYQDDEKVAPLVRQLSWSHNLIILGQSKRSGEREFYLHLYRGLSQLEIFFLKSRLTNQYRTQVTHGARQQTFAFALQ